MAEPFLERLPEDALVLLVGPSGAGKSTWARTRFPTASILSSDAMRELVAGDADDQSATTDAFKVLHAVARARLRRGLLTVVDATNLTERGRRPLLRLASNAARPAVAVVFDTTLERCLAQNAARPGRRVPEDVVRRHHRQLTGVQASLPNEGFWAIHVIRNGACDGSDLGIV